VNDSPPTVRRFAAHEWRAYRAPRLRALRDSPDAFGSTLAREEAFPDDEWVQRLAKGAASPMDFPLIAEDDSRPVGLAWVRIDPVNAAVAELYQVWDDPVYRRRGVGRLVIDSALGWARSSGVRQMLLSVALGPGSALEFYRRLGFVEVGAPEPLRSGSTARKQAMQRTL